MLLPNCDEYDDALAAFLLRASKTSKEPSVEWRGLMTYYAVVFKSQLLPAYCSVFYEVRVFTQEKDEETLIEETREGLYCALEEVAVPPLSLAEVEELASQDEKDGILPKGWRIEPIEVEIE